LKPFNDKAKSIVNPIIFLFLYLSVIAINTQNNWLILEKLKMKGVLHFWDLSTILKYSQCYEYMGDSIQIFDPANYCMNYTYGIFLVNFISLSGLGLENTMVLGGALIILFSITLSFLVHNFKLNKIEIFIMAVLFANPFIFLLLERGNLDLLIYAGMVFAAWLFARNYFFLALFIVVFCTLIKFYAGVVFLFFLLSKTTRLKYLTGTLIITICSLWIVKDFLSVNTPFVQMKSFSFGLTLLPSFFLKLSLTDIVLRVLGLVIFLISAFLVYLAYYVSKRSENNFVFTFKNDFSANLFYFTSLIHLACFFVFVSFNYRLIFLITSLLILILSYNFRRKEFKYLSMAMLCLFSWGSYFYQDTFLVFNLCVLFLTSYVFLVLVKNIRVHLTGISTFFSELYSSW
jgi:hypothetical protein